MGRIPRETIDEIRDRVDIVAVVQKHVSLNRLGKTYKGLCPFHQEKSPSFHVIPDKNIFHCFGCQTGGDAFKFLMLLEGLSFVEAVKELAQSVGITIQEQELTPDQLRSLKRRATAYDVLAAAAEFYRSMLWTRPEGARAREYLQGRGLGQETAQEAWLGFAPDQWTAVTDHLHAKGFSEGLIGDVGLNKVSERRSSRYDTFRNRIVFPIRDERGRVIGFGGRLLDGEGPKYLNSPETSLYAKSKVLYGLYEGRQAVQQNKRVIVVEGYMDVLAMRQAGFGEAVATCGTALTPEHLTKLRRMTDRAIVLFDSDEAGMRAARNALPLFLRVELDGRRLNLPDAKDPDEFLLDHSAAEMEKVIKQSPPLFDWYFARKLEEADYAPGTARKVIEEERELFRTLGPDLIARMAGALRVTEEVAVSILNPPAKHQSGHVDRTMWVPKRPIDCLIWLLMHQYQKVADVIQRAPPALFEPHPKAMPIIARLLTGEPVASVISESGDDATQAYLLKIASSQELFAEENSVAGAIDAVEQLSRNRRLARIEKLLADSKAALHVEDLDRFRAVSSERARLLRLENLLKAATARSDADVVMTLVTEALAAPTPS